MRRLTPSRPQDSFVLDNGEREREREKYEWMALKMMMEILLVECTRYIFLFLSCLRPSIAVMASTCSKVIPKKWEREREQKVQIYFNNCSIASVVAIFCFFFCHLQRPNDRILKREKKGRRIRIDSLQMNKIHFYWKWWKYNDDVWRAGGIETPNRRRHLFVFWWQTFDDCFAEATHKNEKRMLN